MSEIRVYLGYILGGESRLTKCGKDDSPYEVEPYNGSYFPSIHLFRSLLRNTNEIN